MAQALQFASDFKLGHYMKIPPRTMFFAQVSAAAVAGTIQLGVQAWMFSNIVDICSPTQADGFICPSTQVFGTASIIVSDSLVLYELFIQMVSRSGVLLVPSASFHPARCMVASSGSSSSARSAPWLLGLSPSSGQTVSFATLSLYLSTFLAPRY